VSGERQGLSPPWVHRQPAGINPAGLPPHAGSWNAGGRTPEGGQFLDGWYRSLAVGAPLPTLPLALTAERSLMIDLEDTYTQAARRAYLE
jgi:hypothetical protein